jgi:hypothetical protein
MVPLPPLGIPAVEAPPLALPPVEAPPLALLPPPPLPAPLPALPPDPDLLDTSFELSSNRSPPEGLPQAAAQSSAKPAHQPRPLEDPASIALSLPSKRRYAGSGCVSISSMGWSGLPTTTPG